MTRNRSKRDGGHGSCASPDELDALGAVIAAAAAMADRVRSEAASELLHRALILVRDRNRASAEGAERGDPAGRPRAFKTP